MTNNSAPSCIHTGQADDRRGDAYMNALQPLLTVCPWVPIIVSTSTPSRLPHCRTGLRLALAVLLFRSITRCRAVWTPQGNHEVEDGDNQTRYLSQSWGEAGLDQGLPSFPLPFSFIWRIPIYAAYSSNE